MKLIDKNAVKPKFRVGDKLISTRNPSLTYEVLEVGHINELGNLEYKVIIFADGKAKSPQDIHYLECKKVDEWAKLLGPKFKVGDWIVSNVSHEDYRICKILNNDGEYVIESIYGYRGHNNFETFDKDYHLWSIKDAKDGDVLETLNYVYIFNSFGKESETVAFYCLMKKSDKHFSFSDYRIHDEILNSVPAAKEQYNTLMKTMTNEGYTFDFEKKKVKRVYAYEEVNAEDYGIDGLYHAQRILEETLGKVDGYQTDDGILDHKAAITTIKKLYEQKPIVWSEEDEQNLNSVLSYINDEYLRRWLKDTIHRYEEPERGQDNIEYTRTDVLIKKAVEFIKDNGSRYIDIVNGQLVLKKGIIKDFKKHMKGE